jgi:hypothetical protein
LAVLKQTRARNAAGLGSQLIHPVQKSKTNASEVPTANRRRNVMPRPRQFLSRK